MSVVLSLDKTFYFSLGKVYFLNSTYGSGKIICVKVVHYTEIKEFCVYTICID